MQNDATLSRDGTTVSSNARDGLRVKSNAFGASLEYDLGGGWKLDNKFRTATNTGRFMALFPADNANNLTAAKFEGTLFNTSIDNLGLTVNDLKLSTQLNAGGGKLGLTAGLFTSSQRVALTWFWNQYSVDLKGEGANASFVRSGYQTWGGCCARTFDVKYDNTAPYAAVNYEAGPLVLDASVRAEKQKAKGFSLEDNKVNGWDPSTQKRVNYSVNKTNFSLGANYSLNRNTALFARYSDGGAFNADRLLYGNPLDGSAGVPINEIQQTEFGAKWRAQGLSVFATVFNAKTKESNYEATTQKFTSNDYSANGLELEAGYRMGSFSLNGGLTLVSAEITQSLNKAEIGKKPRRQANTVLQLQPSYSFGPFDLGATVIRTGDAFGDDTNTIRMPGYTVVNLFANYAMSDKLRFGATVNNATNALGFTEVEGDGHAARAINGRSVKVSATYSF
jgi:outer membrane receptor protein involved in Fe transport